MKVFISWSGEFSRKVAERLSIWIPTIIQSVDVFYSPDDIAKGENWGNRLSDELKQSNFGIVCLTRENVEAPWINFEAGALSKAANSRVSAIMLGITPSDIKGPLARLQNTDFTRDDFLHLFHSINESSDKPLRQEILETAFKNSWENLRSDIKSIIEDYTSRTPAPEEDDAAHEARDSDSEAIQEILRIVRSLDNSRNLPTSVSASSPSSSRSPEEEIVHLIVPNNQLEPARLIIYKYSQRGPLIGRNIGDNARKYSVAILAEQMSAFKEELSIAAPGTTITI